MLGAALVALAAGAAGCGDSGKSGSGTTTAGGGGGAGTLPSQLRLTRGRRGRFVAFRHVARDEASRPDLA